MVTLETPEQRETRIRSLFNTIDVQGRGQVDAETWFEAAKRLEHPLITTNEEILDPFQLLLDSTKSGSAVNFDQFRQYVLKTENNLRAAFDSFDLTNSGKLNREELRNGLGKLGLNTDDDNRLNLFFDLMNNQHQNGLITYDEWRDFLLFIPSESEGVTVKPTGANIPPCPTLLTAYQFFNQDYDALSDDDSFFAGDTLQGVGYFLAGGLAGVVSRTCTAPFDRLKVYLIANTAKVTPGVVSKELAGTIAAQRAAAAAAGHPRGPFLHVKNYILSSQLGQAAQHIYNRGGARGFFVGNGLNICKVIPESAIKFGSFEAAKRLFCDLEGVADTTELSRTSTFLAGGVGGMVSQFAIYPVDTLKFRIQCEALSADLSGNKLLLRTVRKMWADGGFSLFYRGLWVGVGGIFPFAALDLGTFAAMKRAYITAKAKRDGCDPCDVQMSNIAVLSMGAFSGSVGASVVYPINLLRTRLQAQGTAAHPFTYTGFGDVFFQTVARDGYKGLFRGLAPNLAKVIPAVSISYLVYENAKRVMHLD
ncbi:mitochondrial carrier [Nadsonia fulvescens var. elongata DSM 6958]|uniref:Mitochondrial carrier n=1 Tax=Nadsonia fulvescens var. elongata DSM 6958 TaxID=857566 RepID=A0A1E3PFY0_9ASCO|nr:mitochondrial carrier [Nadsonia fulvescens var. elongata DSM 6958]